MLVARNGGKQVVAGACSAAAPCATARSHHGRCAAFYISEKLCSGDMYVRLWSGWWNLIVLKYLRLDTPHSGWLSWNMPLLSSCSPATNSAMLSSPS